MKRVVLLLSLFFIYSCNSAPKIKSRFSDDITYQLEAEEIEIDELLEPGFAVRTDDYLVFFGESGKKRDLFYVYSLDNLEFLYSFGRNGNAKNEFLLTVPAYYRSQGNKFYVLDSYKRNLFVYELTDKEETLLSIKNLKIPIKQPLGEMSMLNDSVSLFNITDGDGSFLCSYDMEKNKIVDSISFDSHFRELLADDYNPTINDFSLADIYSGDIFIAHTYIDEITKLRLNDDYTFPNNIELKNDNVRPYSSNSISNAIAYYGYIRCQDEYLAATRVCKDGASMHPLNPFVSYDFDLEVYDKNLKPIALLKFDQNFLRFEIDLDRGYIYAWDVKGFDAIHRYNIKEIIK